MAEEISTEKKIKMAYIDVNYIVNQSKDIQELKNETAIKNKDLQIWLSKVNTEVMEKGTRQEQEQLVNQYNQEYAMKQANIRQDYNLKLQQIDAKITGIIAEEAKKLDYDFIFAKGTLLYGGEDITLKIAELVK
ncbi:MAG: hypothetical protein MJ231_02525 [bacterium]|nr:hypothetical protein [bacterium]